MDNTQETLKENKMGVMPVTPLLLNMSLPIMFSMLVMAFYNIVDSVFVSHVDAEAKSLSAISMAFPIQTLMIAMAIGTAVGVNAVLAMKLGAKDYDSVNKTAENGLFLALCNFIVFLIVGVFFVKPYLASQTSDTKIIGYGVDYLSIVLIGSFSLFVTIMSDRILQATGRTFYTMITQLIGAVTNIILDPILIFGLGPFPRMEMAGAALATVIGQILSATASIIFNLKKNPDVNINFRGFRPDIKIIQQIYRIGLPSILLQSINSVTSYGMNLILKSFGAAADVAIAVYGIYFKLNSFVFMPVFGLTTGMVPIVSYNFGARKKDRILKTIKSTLFIALGIMSVGIALFELIPGTLLKIFNAQDELMEIGIDAMRIIAPSFFGAAIAITISSCLQALGKAFNSMIVSFVRQIVVLLPVAFFLSKTGILSNVWYCFLVAEVFAIALSCYFFFRLKKKVIDVI